MPKLARQNCQSAHKGAANPENMDVHLLSLALYSGGR
jgi:hypothetical protein